MRKVLRCLAYKYKNLIQFIRFNNLNTNITTITLENRRHHLYNIAFTFIDVILY